MADQLTTITLPGTAGMSEWGRQSRAAMIGQYREMAARQLAEAQAVLAAPDDAFTVYQHTGVHVQHNRVDLSPPCADEAAPDAAATRPR